MSDFDPASILPDDLLERFRERAAVHDRENTFPDDDLAELKAAGYLAILAPKALGGGGLGLAEASVLQQRLAGAAPATALAINMHLVWTGVAKVLADRGIDALRFVQEGAVAGEVFAFGISEAGNDLVLFGSDTDAAPAADGVYAFTGTKIFTSLAPVWTQLGLHGLDTTSPDAPKLVYAFVPRSEEAAGRVVTRDDWDTLGMRATQSRTTELHGAVAPADRVVRRIDPGPNPDPIVFGIFSVFELLLASVYTGIARRALDLAVETAGRRRSKKTGLAYSQDPDIRWRIADMALAYDALPPQLRRCAATSTSAPITARGGSRCSPASSTARSRRRRRSSTTRCSSPAGRRTSRARSCRALPRCARRALPPLRPGIGALDGRHRWLGRSRTDRAFGGAVRG